MSEAVLVNDEILDPCRTSVISRFIGTVGGLVPGPRARGDTLERPDRVEAQALLEEQHSTLHGRAAQRHT